MVSKRASLQKKNHHSQEQNAVMCRKEWTRKMAWGKIQLFQKEENLLPLWPAANDFEKKENQEHRRHTGRLRRLFWNDVWKHEQQWQKTLKNWNCSASTIDACLIRYETFCTDKTAEQLSFRLLLSLTGKSRMQDLCWMGVVGWDQGAQTPPPPTRRRRQGIKRTGNRRIDVLIAARL